ncbi:hypothetical protein NLU13_5100 [Sarocladium strictum]|uniref:Zn(2)-C6 fungal-type domain-containing protein n=1 Tax=Sarocladium strictum TaxID=5046 RepID=A0AA39GMT2_SARSR|nr:hypothetical protein NLU13_5100 [Sarocladium strictum]
MSGSNHSHSGSPGSHGDAQSHVREKKRRRPALACEQCRKRKVRCDRTKPCGPCLKARISPCTYAPTHVPAVRGKKGPAPKDPQESSTRQYDIRPAPVTRRGSTAGVWSTLKGVVQPPQQQSRPRSSNQTSIDGSTNQNAADVDRLIQKVNFLQEKLNSVSQQVDSSDSGPKRWPGHATLQHQEKGKIVKTRYYSCGHWMHGAYLFPTELSILVHAESSKGDVFLNLMRCKDLARKIKEARLQPLISNNLGNSLPARALADQLIENYIRAFEGPMRILHIPSFRSEYHRFLQSPESAGTPFRMQLQLCLAIGAALQDDTFTLRQSAMQWVYEAQIWMMLPSEKDRITYMGVQIMCLICLARTVCSAGADLAWIGGGQLLRMAVYMGLHRDPLKLGTMSVYRAEMRRRLWATVMELDVQFAIDAGASSLMDSMDYDTLAPANLNDDQLTDENEKERPASSDMPAMKVPTQASVQIALHRSLPVRLAILRHINGIDSHDSYNATLGLNSSLVKECRLLSKTLHGLKVAVDKESPDNLDAGPVTSFHIKIAELGVYRLFHTLHQPVIIQSLEDPRFYFSRKMFHDSALKTGRLCNLILREDEAEPLPKTLPERDFVRFLSNGAGMIRSIVAQSMMGIGLHIIYLKEEQSLSLGYISTGLEEGMGAMELKSYIKRTIELSKRRIRSGETGVKMLCFISAAMARHQQTAEGAERSAIHQAILESATEASKVGLELLKERAQLEGTPLPSADAEDAEVNNGPIFGSTGSILEGRNPTIFGPLQAMGGFGGYGYGDGMDWMTDWTLDNMPVLGWPDGGQQAWDQGLPTGAVGSAVPAST